MEDEIEDDGDVAAGPEMLPDEDQLSEDDEEGRFFGSGLNKNTADVMDFIDEQDKDEVVCLNACSVQVKRRLTVAL